MNDQPTQQQRLDAISTRWSLLRDAHGGSFITGGSARQALVLRYVSSVRTYVAAILRGGPDADEISQEVVMRILKGDFAGADPTRGRFRDLLKTAIRNMVRNHWDKQKRRKGVDYDANLLADDVGDPADDDRWTEAWRKSLLDQAWQALERHERSTDGNVYFTVLRLRTDFPDDSSDELAERLGKKFGKPVRADALRQKLRRARVMFAELLLAEISKGLDQPTPEQVDEELSELGLLEFVRELVPVEQ